MKNIPIDARLFIQNRDNLRRLMQKNTLAVVNSNDIPATNADGSLLLWQNSDLFYLTGIDQEETRLLLFPDASDESLREILFVRESNPLLEIWEGHKFTKEEARAISGIANVQWIGDFEKFFHRLLCESEGVYLNSNEHKRAAIETETRDARFVRECQARYPLHQYHRLARLMHRLRIVKSEVEVDLIRQASDLTGRGFRRVLGFVKPGVNEMEVEAEFAHEFIRQGSGFSYSPIIASGANACVLHYVQNNQVCRDGDLLLLDVGARCTRYHSDMTRTIPVNGRFNRRQKQVYQSVLRILREVSGLMGPGKLPQTLQRECEAIAQRELVNLGLLKTADLKKRDAGDPPAFKKYFMHGVSHPIGLDVHDVGYTTEPMQAGWVVTCEPAIYIREEGLAVRLENTVLITEKGAVDLMGSIPLEVEEIEAGMAATGRGKSRGPRAGHK